MYVADSGNGAIKEIKSSGETVTLVSGLGFPRSIVAYPGGTVYFLEYDKHIVSLLNPDNTTVKIYENRMANVMGLGMDPHFSYILYISVEAYKVGSYSYDGVIEQLTR